MSTMLQRWVLRRSSAAVVGTLSLLCAITLPPAVAAAAPATPVVTGVTVANVAIDPAYWRNGARVTATVVITVHNPGGAATEIRGTYTWPAGTHRVAVTGSNGCSTRIGQAFTCRFAAGETVGTINLKLLVDPDDWRMTPLSATASVTSAGTVLTDTYALILPAGPPTAGMTLTADDVSLPTTAPDGVAPDGVAPGGVAPAEGAAMTVRLANTTGAAAPAIVEVVTPAGVDLVDFPALCVAHHQVAPSRQQCDLGPLGPGQESSLAFGLQVAASGRGGAPLVGAVYGTLSPTGRDPLTTQAPYQVTVSTTGAIPESSSPSPPSPSSSSSPSATAEKAVSSPAAAPDRRITVKTDDIFSTPLSTVTIVGSVVGLVTIAGVIGVLSLRRRLQDDI